MEPACRKDKPKLNSTPTRGDRAKQKSAQQELKQRQRAEIYALNKVMTELEQQQFEAFCKQMQSQGECGVLLSSLIWTRTRLPPCRNTMYTHTITDIQSHTYIDVQKDNRCS
ncbi:small vasohibin-binding protein-like [Sebastes fasciatus]|uniref:small vasohibin-binding protein-like n=1 Tax=Sebastes fasciatus TaxID=394691 RepID=UPI003D9ED57C